VESIAGNANLSHADRMGGPLRPELDAGLLSIVEHAAVAPPNAADQRRIVVRLLYFAAVRPSTCNSRWHASIG
jgi:hypothetical protein